MIGKYREDEILLFGPGWLGTKIANHLGCQVAPDLPITEIAWLVNQIRSYGAKVIINAIGMTGFPNTDACEKEPEKTFRANTWIPLLMAKAALETGVRLVHLGSGCMYHFNYDLDSPIKETEPPNYFELIYSQSKAAAEEILQFYSQRVEILICRIRIPLDVYPSPKNVLTKLLGYGRVFRERNSITYVPDFLEMIKFLITEEKIGIFNTVNSGGLYYPDLMNEWIRQNHPDLQYQIIGAEDIPGSRTNLLLATDKLRYSGFPVRDINDVLEECVREYIKNGG